MKETGEGPDSESAYDGGLGKMVVVSMSMSVTSDVAKAPSRNMSRLKGKIPAARNAETIIDALNFSRKGALQSGATS